MPGLDHAITGLQQALERPRRHEMWRWLVRHRVGAVLDALAGTDDGATDAWLDSRQTMLTREGELLHTKLDRLASLVVEAPDLEPVLLELQRLVTELRRHRQRLNDLVYDTVALDLGGSE